MKIADQLKRLQRVAPKRDKKTGFLFRTRSTVSKSYKRVTMHVLIVSDENTHMIHSAQFKSEHARTPAEWRMYFNDPAPEASFDSLIEYIYAMRILPGISVRTNKSWGVQRWIGFTATHHALHEPKASKVARKRH